MKRLLAVLLALAIHPASSAVLEHEVKAAFLFNFLPFIEWPQEALAAPGHLVVGVLAADEIAAELQRAVPGRSVGGRAVAVRRLEEGEPPAGVHLLFRGRARDAGRLAPGVPIAIACDWPAALEQGCAINFVESAGRIRFEVDLRNAERRRVRISARMLAVAQAVRGAR